MKIYDENWKGGKIPLDIDQIPPGLAEGVDYEITGRRVRERREQLGLTAKECAARARISRQTLAKFEAGEPFKASTLRRLQFVLGLYTQELTRAEESDEYANLRSPEELRWGSAYPRSRYVKTSSQATESDVNDPEERDRLGRSGLQPFFLAMFNNHLQNGTLRTPGLMELHQPSWFDQHPGEECVYCLRGSIRMIVRDKEFDLHEGSCLIFKAFQPHKYVPIAPGADGRPPLILVVLAQSPEDAQMGIRTWPSDEEIQAARQSPTAANGE